MQLVCKLTHHYPTYATCYLFYMEKHNFPGKCLVHRPAYQQSPAAEGWIPGHVLGHTSNTLKRPSKSKQGEQNPDQEDSQDVTISESNLSSPRRSRGRRRLRKLSNKTLAAAQSLPSLNDDSATVEVNGNHDITEDDNLSIVSSPTHGNEAATHSRNKLVYFNIFTN